jgi:hypothetical protein
VHELRPDKPAYSIYFADGLNENRDLQFTDPELEKNCPPARRMMAQLMGDGESVSLRYRSHKVPDVTGPTEKDLLADKFRRLGRELKPGDRLIVYVDGHGNQAYGGYDYDYDEEEWVEKESEDGAEVPYNKYDTSIMIWDSDSVTAAEFNRWLDRIHREIPVILVMGQCYAGGFSHAIFHRNDADLGLSPHARCGFFAQMHDRQAAGCTPDDAIEEYSSYFWAALGGKSRKGEPVAADFDGNGAVSFAEAHAHAILESTTYDVPVQTSGALLRRYSRIGGQRGDDEPAQDDNPLKRLFGGSATKDDAEGDGLKSANGKLSDFHTSARPEQKAVLERMPAKLALEPSATVENVRVKLRQLQSLSGVARAKLGVAHATLQRVQAEAQEEIQAIYPELQSAYSPTAAELTSERAAEFVEHVNSMTSYEALAEARKKLEELEDEFFKAEGEQAKAERLLQAVEEIVLAANLARTAPAEVVERYKEILKLEGQALALQAE